MAVKFDLFATCHTKKGRIIAPGKNSYTKTHPLMLHLASKVGLPDKVYLHAEVQALLRCGDKVPYRLFVQRFGAAGNPLMAAPCPICREAIKMYGVKEVWYTNDSGEITKEKI